MSEREWKKAVAFHGHECPGLAIGVKACEAARHYLEVCFSEDEQLVCVTENDACCVDAIQVLAGCSIGKGNLIYRQRGKMAFSFFNRNDGRKVRLVLKSSFSRDGADRAAVQAAILRAKPEELFDFKEPSFVVPATARLFNSLICDKCGESAMEQLMRIADGGKVCLDCFDDYSRGW